MNEERRRLQAERRRIRGEQRKLNHEREVEEYRPTNINRIETPIRLVHYRDIDGGVRQQAVYLDAYFPDFDDDDDQELNEQLLDQYNFERLSPEERRALWEQEHIREMEQSLIVP